MYEINTIMLKNKWDDLSHFELFELFYRLYCKFGRLYSGQFPNGLEMQKPVHN